MHKYNINHIYFISEHQFHEKSLMNHNSFLVHDDKN